MKVYCHCLNVSLCLARDTYQDCIPYEMPAFFKQCLEDDLFFSMCAEADLDVGGIHIMLPCLIHSRLINDWSIYTCSNCDMPVYAQYQTEAVAKVYVSTKLKHNSKDIDTLYTSPFYSNVYSIILHPGPDTDEVVDKNESTPQDDNLSKEIDSGLRKFLHEQHGAMKDRIQQYTEEQEAAYMELQRKSQKDEELVSKVYRMCKEKAENSSATSIPIIHSNISVTNNVQSQHANFIVGSPPYSSPIDMSPGMQYNWDEALSSSSLSNSTNPIRGGSLLAHSNAAQSRLGNHLDSKQDDGMMFDMDETPHDSNAFFDSDEEENTSTDDGSVSDDQCYQQGKYKQQIYASSLPITIAGWSSAPYKTTNTQISEENEEKDEFTRVSVAPEQIAASMRAMSMSVRDNEDSGLIGDRPSRKINISELVKKRL